MPLVEFRITILNQGSWSGEDHDHTHVQELDAALAAQLEGRRCPHAWPDGLTVEFSARTLADGAPDKPSSQDLPGLDWLVDRLLHCGQIDNTTERVTGRPPSQDREQLMRTTCTQILPPAIRQRLVDREAFSNDVERYIAMHDDDLLRATVVCLQNLGRLDDETGPDGHLQVVLVPELWERLRPGTRDVLRRISSTLAEHDPDPARPSIFGRLLSAEARARLREEAITLRHRIKRAASLDTTALVEQVRFAIAGSRAADHHAPHDFVYEPGFVYRLVPVIACRAVLRTRGAAVVSPAT